MRELIELLVPHAEAILEARDQLDLLDGAAAEHKGLQKKISEGKDQLKSMQVIRDAAKKSSEDAKAEAIRQKSIGEQILADAKVEALRLLNEAKRDAALAVETVKAELSAGIKALEAERDRLKIEVEQLRSKIPALRGEHDQVLASMNSLKKRLG